MKGSHRVKRIIISCDYCNKTFEIRETETNRRFCCHKCYTDWYSENLIGINNPTYKDRIIKLCKYCGKEMKVTSNDGVKFCSFTCKNKWQSKFSIGKNSSRWIEKIIKKCKYCGIDMEVTPHEFNIKIFCSRGCLGKWLSENNCGENHPFWLGGLDAQQHRRRGLGYEPLNDKFPGSDGHHINKTIVIHIPKELHRHIGHDLRSGRGMDVINALAFQYLFGYYNG